MDSTRVTAFSQGDSPERWSEYDEFRWAQELLDQRRPGRAVPVLETLLTQVRASAPEQVGVVRAELARAYFHAARLSAAEQLAREAFDADPTDAQAGVLLARVLQRRSRHTEAAALLPRLEALLGPAHESMVCLRERAR